MFWNAVSYLPVVGNWVTPKPLFVASRKTEVVVQEIPQNPEESQLWKKKVRILDPKDVLKQVIGNIKNNPEMVQQLLSQLEMDTSADQSTHHHETLKALLTEQTDKVFEHYDDVEKLQSDWVIVERNPDTIEQKKEWPKYITIPAYLIYGTGKIAYRTYVEVTRLGSLILLGAVVLQSPWLPILKLVLSKVLK